jgi:hypothetical protein
MWSRTKPNPPNEEYAYIYAFCGGFIIRLGTRGENHVAFWHAYVENLRTSEPPQAERFYVGEGERRALLSCDGIILTEGMPLFI